MGFDEAIKAEFINLADTDINPLIKKCDIKVFYLGENRNHSYIDKPTALEMSKTLRGVPIVGWYSKDKGDFRDHGEEMVINGDGVAFNTKTKPYGFVPTNADVWFQDFFETDAEGYTVKRTYMVTQGFLWTGQFKEIEGIFNNSSKGQSMELDGDSLDGSWTKDYDLFIINDATFSKLCILGDDVEPCFEGASVTPSKYNLNDNLKEEIRTMMRQFSLALEGGNKMDSVEQTPVTEVVETAEPTTDFSVVAEEIPTPAETEPTTEPAPDTFVKKEEEKKEEEEKPSSDDSGEKKESSDEKKEEDKDKKYALLETEYFKLQSEVEGLNAKITALEAEKAELVTFKLGIENKQKDELIAKFTTLTDEEKADIIANKEKYSLNDIESKLSILYCRKNMEQAKEEKIENKEPITTFNLTEVDEPDWVKAVKSHRAQD